MTDNNLVNLPIPTKEKATRWLIHIGMGALAVAGIIKFMPFVNHALSLLLDGVLSVTQLGLAVGGIAFVTYAGMALWPAYKKFMESLANKAVWAVFEYDPITPMVLWLKEVHRDREELDTQYGQVCGVITQNEQMVNDNQQKAAKADKLFAQAVKQYGQDSHEAQMMSLEPGTLRETANRVSQITKTLYTIRDILKEVVEVTEFTERKAELDVTAYKQEFTTAQRVEQATNAANRLLKGRSQRKADAIQAMEIIHNKYAGSFGRLQGLKQLSQELITSVDMTKGTYHEEALERLKNESRMITGNKQEQLMTVNVLDAIPNGKINGVSLYKVSGSSSASDSTH